MILACYLTFLRGGPLHRRHAVSNLGRQRLAHHLSLQVSNILRLIRWFFKVLGQGRMIKKLLQFTLVKARKNDQG